MSQNCNIIGLWRCTPYNTLKLREFYQIQQVQQHHGGEHWKEPVLDSNDQLQRWNLAKTMIYGRATIQAVKE